MKIKITTAFFDKQAQVDRAIDDEITVTAERGQELVDLGLAMAVKPVTAAPAKPNA